MSATGSSSLLDDDSPVIQMLLHGNILFPLGDSEIKDVTVWPDQRWRQWLCKVRGYAYIESRRVIKLTPYYWLSTERELLEYTDPDHRYLSIVTQFTITDYNSLYRALLALCTKK